MNQLVVTPALDEKETEQAFRLALSVFEENTGMNDYASYKSFNWKNDPAFDPQNILCAYVDDELVGMTRVVPRTLFRGSDSYSVAGISSVCLSPAFRNKGLSVPLIEQSLDVCRERSYDIAFLFARRAADHYYTKFGFHGVTSYSRVTVKNDAYGSNDALSLSEPDIGLIGLYNEAYQENYQNCFGRFDRNSAYWQFLLQSLSWRKEFRFYTIRMHGIAVGYMILNGRVISEIAIQGDISADEILQLIHQKAMIGDANEPVELEILPQHRLMPQLSGKDVTLHSRECSYGGRMLRILNISSVYGNLRKRDPAAANRLNDIEQKSNWSYSETCDLLGINTPTNRVQDGRLPFDISAIDHF